MFSIAAVKSVHFIFLNALGRFLEFKEERKTDPGISHLTTLPLSFGRVNQPERAEDESATGDEPNGGAHFGLSMGKRKKVLRSEMEHLYRIAVYDQCLIGYKSYTCVRCFLSPDCNPHHLRLSPDYALRGCLITKKLEQNTKTLLVDSFKIKVTTTLWRNDASPFSPFFNIWTRKICLYVYPRSLCAKDVHSSKNNKRHSSFKFKALK